MISASIGSADRNSSAITTTSIQPIVTVVPSSFVHTTNSPHQPHPSHQPLDLLSNPALIISKTKSKLTASLFGQGSALPFRNRKHKLVTSSSRSSRPEKRLKIDPSEATSSISTPSIEDTPEMILLLDSRNHHHNKQSRLSSATSSASSSGEDNNSFLQLLPRNSNFCSEETDTEKDFDCTATTGGTDRLTSSHSKYLANIQLVLDIWQGRMNHVHPETYLQHLLKSRGYDSSYLSSYDLKLQRDGFFHTDKELHDYDNEIIHAVRTSNIGKIRKLHHNGRSLTACNRFSESIVHMACRRADYSTVEYLLTNIPSVLVVDDYGRTPLHDACWRAEPQFDIVALLLDKYLDLIRCKDRRGASPLQYVQKDHWHLWCAFLDSQKEKYWAPIYNPNPSSAPMTSFSHHQSYHDADCSNNSSVPV